MEEFQHLKISLEDIKIATDNFNENKVIGEGGFGKVYKGEVSHSKGRDLVAFKRLNSRFGQGELEFWKEVIMLSRYTHANLISLLAFCNEGSERIVVYEYASRGSLDRYLSSIDLTWTQRIMICLDAAKGISYLHNDKGTHQILLHRDIKSSNILLDDNWTAKVSDLGLSKIGPANQLYTTLITHAVGTPGYCDPLYMETYFLTKESDVYSFGVVLFEVLCGRLCYEYRNGQSVFLVRRWKEGYEQNKLDELIFQNLTQQMSPKSFATFSDIAFQCLHRNREQRPRMSFVVEKLEIALKVQRRHDLKLPEEHEEIPAVVNALGIATDVFSPAHQYGIQNRFESRESIFKGALKFLNSDNETQKMMALCGMGGVGKTTMMEQLKEAVMNSKKFDWIVKVVIGENTNPVAFQQAIAEKVGEILTETTKDARAERLRNKFIGMSQNGKKKILVIVDDLWKEFDLKDVGLASPLPNGFKILFTSRFENVCTQMGVETVSIFKVAVLNDEEAKSLFFGIVGLSVSDGDDPELQKIGENIAMRCGGLPIAVKTMANYLRDNIEDAWKDAFSRLEHHDLQDLYDIVHTVFEMSYNNLKKDEDKAVFLLCGLFPDDFDIRIEDLMRYGWGLKLYNKVYTLAEARWRTNTCVNNLMRANLLTESDEIECVKMHDLVRAFVLSNFSKVKQASFINHENMSTRLAEDAYESYERILLNCTGMAELPSDFNYQDLSFFMLMNGNRPLKFPDDVYERMEKLKVLSYEKMLIPLLPASFKYSTKLRTLCLHSCRLLDDFSILGSLSNLEILSFAHCKIKRLPSMIGKLKNLKLLDLTGCVALCIDDGVFRNLVSLEELYMRVFGSRPIRFTDVNCDELEILSGRLSVLELEFFETKATPKNVSFKKLDRFMISIGCKFKHNETYSYKKTLHLVADCNDLLECNMSVLFEKTEELHLQVNDMSHLEDLTMCPSQYSFCNLRVLTVFNCSLLTCLFTFPVARGLKRLERLIISKCPVLKVLVDENREVEVIKFQKLKFMSLKDLPSLISLCDIVNVIELPELMELKLEVLPNFTSIYSDNNDTSTMQSLINREVVISKLEKLDISLMSNLKQIWPCQIATTEKNTVSMLREVHVTYCDGLVNLFPNNPLPLLNNLEKLKVKHCGSIEVLFNIDLDCIWEIEKHRSRLRNIKVEGLKNLRELWRMKGANYADILVSGFKGVESIEITDCWFFTNVFTPTQASFDLEGLATYIAQNADRFDWRNMKSNQESNVIFKEEISNIDDDFTNVTYTSHLVHSCHHLQHLELSGDRRVEVVFDMDSPSSRALPTSQDSRQPLQLPYLKVLTLSNLENMHHVWKCNGKKFPIAQQPLKLPFHDLTNIYLKSCEQLKYLFSPLMAKYFYNLKYVHISDCFSMEEVVSSRDDNIGTFESLHRNNTLFPHVDTLELSGLSSLKRIDGVDTVTSNHDQFQGAQVVGSSWSLCQYPRKIIIDSCEALESVIPCYAVGQMKRLEKLEISLCSMITEVFESQMINKSTNVDEGSASGSISNALASATLQNMNFVPKLSNLKVMMIATCHLLRNVFSFSTLESLKQLKKLSVYECKETKVIVEEEKGVASKVGVILRLETLELVDLPKLKGLFLGMNGIRWPFLDTLIIKDCPQMMVFTSGQSNAPKLKYVRTSLGKHSVEHDHNFHRTTNQDDQARSGPTILKQLPIWSFHNLIEIDSPEKYIKNIIPSNALLQLQMLEKIDLSGSYLVEEVFEVAREGTNNTSGFSELQTVVEVPNLREIYLKWLHELKYIWKSNQGMVLEFPTLTRMSIQNCNSLEHVFTCSMVGSLLQLQDLDISNCGTIKVIVKEEQECDAKVNEIMLPRLKSLTLRYLPYLKGFYLGNKAFSWPCMDALEIMECPQVTIFTKGPLATPELKVIDTRFGKLDLTEDVNSFIHTKQVEGHSM
uniref:uncharacterized protein LOC122578755 isoform X2 n=1 Tax=Erigeron canadensis TaxID=72917 RepID=UPI001CB9BB52|nr:uncharacterized protein LOC122578755 isoform X2 [Erigeron canadensis]